MRVISVRIEEPVDGYLGVDHQTFRGTTEQFAEAFDLSAGHEPARSSGRCSDGFRTIEWNEDSA